MELRLGAPILEVRDLGCERDDRVLFDGLTFSLPRGRGVQLRGPNGAGKTTLLRCLAGLSGDYAGTIELHGDAAHRAAGEAHGETVFVGHRAALAGALSPRENLAWLLALRGRAATGIDEALSAVGLYGYEDMPCRRLSAGQQRRAGLARLALASATADEASLWLLDEPFTALDGEGVDIATALMNRHLAAGDAIVVATHQVISDVDGLDTLWLGAPGAAT